MASGYSAKRFEENRGNRKLCRLNPFEFFDHTGCISTVFSLRISYDDYRCLLGSSFYERMGIPMLLTNIRLSLRGWRAASCQCGMLVALTLFVLGCAGPPIIGGGAGKVKPPPHANKYNGVVHVFYATDRKIDPGAGKPEYTAERSDNETLSLGTLDVSIPRDHKMGEIERPSIWRFEFSEDPEKHVVLLGVSPKPESVFFKELSQVVSTSAHNQAFVFVHGYDVTFADAAMRTAQLAYDLGFEGAPILYSWPSKGQVQDYPADEASIEWAAPHLKNFLEKIAANSNATTVHLIAHSMGNRALTKALSSIAEERPEFPHIFKQVFLAAPDIDAGVFKQLAESFPKAASQVTLYASSNDKALLASKKFHDFPRAGDTATFVTVVPRVDTIDGRCLSGS